MAEIKNTDTNSKYEKVIGGENVGYSYTAFRCSNPKCPNYSERYFACGEFCDVCGSRMESVVVDG